MTQRRPVPCQILIDERAAGDRVVHVIGSLTICTHASNLQRLTTLGPELRLNLARAQLEDTSGLALLLELKALAGRDGVRLSIESASESTLRLIELFRLQEVLISNGGDRRRDFQLVKAA